MFSKYSQRRLNAITHCEKLEIAREKQAQERSREAAAKAKAGAATARGREKSNGRQMVKINPDSIPPAKKSDDSNRFQSKHRSMADDWIVSLPTTPNEKATARIELTDAPGRMTFRKKLGVQPEQPSNDAGLPSQKPEQPDNTHGQTSVSQESESAPLPELYGSGPESERRSARTSTASKRLQRIPSIKMLQGALSKQQLPHESSRVSL